MLNYLVTIKRRDADTEFSGTFSDEDVEKLHTASAGRPFDLEKYKAYICGDGAIALAVKPDYEDSVMVEHRELCHRLREACAF
jgi:hypothetical protein